MEHKTDYEKGFAFGQSIQNQNLPTGIEVVATTHASQFNLTYQAFQETSQGVIDGYTIKGETTTMTLAQIKERIQELRKLRRENLSEALDVAETLRSELYPFGLTVFWVEPFNDYAIFTNEEE